MHLQPPQSRRSGLTLAELLVVIGIIAAVLALGAGAYLKWMSTQGRRNTQTRITAIHTSLKESWNKVIEDARKESPSRAVYLLAGNDRERAQVIWIKTRLMEAFPMRYSEIDAPLVYTPLPLLGNQPLIPLGRRKYLAVYKDSLGGKKAAADPLTESAACLYIALSSGRGSANTKWSDQTKDTDGDGVREFVDDWGKPLHFFRFPTGDAKLRVYNPADSARSANFRDPLDPGGALVARTWNTSLRQLFERAYHKVSASGGPPAYYVTPVIASAGIDELLGLNRTTMAVTNIAETDDNVVSYHFRIGGELK